MVCLFLNKVNQHMNTHVVNFKKIFQETAKQSNRYDVFRDFVYCVSIAIENAFLKCENKETEYLSIVGKYKKEDVSRFTEMYAELVLAFDYKPGDILGELFMELEISSAHLGQYFTPFSLCKVMAELNVGENLDEQLSKNGYITVSEPASGSGSMLIAFSESMRGKGYNPQRQIYFHAIDLDPVAAKMAYIQLSTLGLVAEVVIGNTLTLEFRETMKTPAYYLWGHTLKQNSKFDAVSKSEHKDDDEPFCLNLNLFSNFKITKLEEVA